MWFIIGNLMFGWVGNLEASICRVCLNNYGKRHSGQFPSIYKEHSTYPEELEDDFLSNSLPKPLSDFFWSENYSSGSHKQCDHYLTDLSEPLLNLLELGRCIAWRWSRSNTVVSICQLPLETGQQNFRHASELCHHVLVKPERKS